MAVRDVLYIDDLDTAAALLKPARLSVLRGMADPTTCTELAQALGSTPQKVHYHVKALEHAGVLEKVAERKVRGIHEGIYRATARSYWLSPHLVVGRVGARRTRDQASLGYLISLAEEVQEDVGRLAASHDVDEHIPSLGLAAHIDLRDAATREEFMHAVTEMFQALAERFASPTDTPGSPFRLALACYPERREVA